MTAQPRAHSARALRLACWDADSVRGRKLQLNHFLGKHGVDICILKHISEQEKSFGSQIMFATVQRVAEQEYWSAGI